jgi:Legionella pneumophila major outer membrane protein precursor
MVSVLKNCLACFLVLLSISSYAAFMGPECTGVSVTLPFKDNLWKIGAQGLYLQPAFNSTDIIPRTLSAWGGGFGLEAGLEYGIGRDIDVQWYRFQQIQNYRLDSPVSYLQTIVHSTTLMQPEYYDSLLITQEKARFNPQWDKVNIELAKTIQLGESDSARFHAGLNYSRIAILQSFSWQTQTTLNHHIQDIQSDSSKTSLFNGLGLRSGMHLSHQWENGLKVDAHSAISILAGTQKQLNQLTENLDGRLYHGVISNRSREMLSAIDGQIGLSYKYFMVQGELRFDLGWLWANYFNLEDTYFGVQGAYFGLKWAGVFL